MTRNPALDMVQEFHDETGIITPTFACVPDWTPANSGTLMFAADQLRKLTHVLRSMSAANNAPRCLQRIALEAEELAELADAMARNDLLGVFDAELDGEYVGIGTAIECGLGLVHDPGMELVHESNMSKRFDDGTFHRDDSGKIIKGPNYMPVNLRPLLARVTKKHQP